MEWKSFGEESPEIGKLILYGNSHSVDIAIYYPDNPKMKETITDFQHITHWCYVDMPLEEWETI